MSIAGRELTFDTNVVKFYIALMKMAIETQQPTVAAKDSNIATGLVSVLTQADSAKAKILSTVLSLLDTINTTATDKCEALAGSSAMIDLVTKNICSMQDNILTNLISMLGELGCILVIGNDKAFTVPEAGYLKVPKIPPTHKQQISVQHNVIFPAEYDSVSFNDGGYVNIKGMYVVADAAAGPNPISTPVNIEEGSYVDKSANANGNIQTVTMPTYINWGLVSSAINGSQGIQPFIQSHWELLPKKIYTSEATTTALNSAEMIIQTSLAKTKLMNQWAEMEYCKTKYDDRTGSIHCYFNMNWAPGAMGTLYTLQPGTYLDFFVTNVTHNFQLTPPNSGEATTSIAFKSGRLGATANIGIEQLSFYKYDYAASQDFCSKFITDIVKYV